MNLEFFWPRIMTDDMQRFGVPQYQIIADRDMLHNYVNQRLFKQKHQHDEGRMLAQFAEGATLEQVGAAHDLTKERVRQILLRVMRALLDEIRRDDLARWGIRVYPIT